MPAKKSNKPTRSDPTPVVPARVTTPLWFLAGALAFWSFGYTTMRGSDLWWHLAGGRWMWEHGAVWVNDPFSFSAAGKEWLNDAWLSGVLLHLWTQWLSLESLAHWKWAMIVVTWLLLFRLAWRGSGDATASFVACLLSLAVAAPFLDVRPQLFSFFSWVLLLDLCLYREQPSKWVPLVMLLWVNLHAGFFLGLITLPILLLPYWVDGQAATRRKVLLIGVLGAAATLVNPNGLEVVTRPLLHAFDTDSPYRTLAEWLPPFRPGGIQSPIFPYGIAAFAAAAAISLWKLLNSRRRLADAVPLALAVLTLAMALQSRRFVPFFAITEVLIVAPALAIVTRAVLSSVPAYVPATAGVLIGALWMSGRPIAAWTFDDLTARDTFPIEMCSFVEENQLSGKVFNYYNWGGYLHWCTQGRMKVYIDGRAETVYDDKTFLDYLKALHQRPGWEAVIDDSGAQFVLWPLNTGRLAQTLSTSPKWKLLHQDMVSVLFARADMPLAELKPPPDSAYRDLNLGIASFKAGQVQEAIAQFEKALLKDPHMYPACVALARSQAAAGRIGDAHATVDRCAAMTSDDSQIPALRAVIDATRARAATR